MICLKKRPVNVILTLADRKINQKFSHDRIYVENYFERVCSMGLFSQNWCSNKIIYIQYFRTVFALKDLHIIYNPLHTYDSKHFRTVFNRLYSIGSSIVSIRSAFQQRYHQVRKRRINSLASRVVPSDSSDDDSISDVIDFNLITTAPPAQ